MIPRAAFGRSNGGGHEREGYLVRRDPQCLIARLSLTFFSRLAGISTLARSSLSSLHKLLSLQQSIYQS